MRVASVIAVLLLAGCGQGADPAAALYEKATIDDYPFMNSVATTVYFRNCGTKGADGRVTCHACVTDLFVAADGKIDVDSDNNEHILDASGEKPEMRVTGELSHQYDPVAPETGKAEAAKGAESFQKYLTGLFEKGNAWCKALGGERHDIKNELATAASKVQA